MKTALEEGGEWKLLARERVILARMTICDQGKCYLIIDKDHEWKLESIGLAEGFEMEVEVPRSEGVFQFSVEFDSYGPDIRRVIVVKTPAVVSFTQRRGSSRFKLLLDCTVSHGEDEAADSGALIRDISRGGAKLLVSRLPEGIDVGSRMILEFSSVTAGKIIIEGEVRRVVKRAGGHEIGLAFDLADIEQFRKLSDYVDGVRQDREQRGMA